MKEPANNLDEIVPGRLTSAELRAMALRQQQQIDSQHQLLATKEQRLRFLKSQEVRSAVANAEGERLRRLRERVEAQESKLRRLRALRGQVDLQKTYNVTLSNDLDSIRALFSEKEKELSLAVAKVEALTRQLEDLRRDRRGPMGLISNGSAASQQNLPPQASHELEKLRRELMYRNQLSLQQDARLHLQREALQQRQAELRSVDQRIYELQTRLQRKKSANVQIGSQNQQLHLAQLQQQQQQLQQQQQQKQQQHQKQQQSGLLSTTQQHLQQRQTNMQLPFGNENATAYQTNHAKHGGVAALKQQLLAKQANHVAPVQQKQQHGNNSNINSSNSNNSNNNSNNFTHNIAHRGENSRNMSRGNIAAVEPYIHTPQKTSNSQAGYMSNASTLKHAATANTNLQNQLIQDLAHVKLNAVHSNAGTLSNPSANYFGAESDESKLAKKMLTATLTAAKTATDATTIKPQEQSNSAMHIYAEVGPKKRDLVKEVAANLEAQASTASTANATGTSQTTSKIPKSILSNSTASTLINKLNSNASGTTSSQPATRERGHEAEKKSDVPVASETLSEKNKQQLTVHSMPLGAANKALAIAVTTTAAVSTSSDSTSQKPKSLQQPGSNASGIAVPPRKPISSVAPTSVTSSIPKMISYSPKVNRVAPSVVVSSTATTTTTTTTATTQEIRPALPPKPSKMSPTESTTERGSSASSPNSGSANGPHSTRRSSPDTNSGLQSLNINDNLPIKAKPLTIRKQPLSEQPRLKLTTSSLKSSLASANRKLDIPATSALLFNDDNKASNGTNNSEQTVADLSNDAFAALQQQPQHSPSLNSQSSSNVDEPDRADSSHTSSELAAEISKQRMRNNAGTGNSNNGKPKLARRVSFDPLALLLDASLEGELELVKKTAMQVANPSAANDEGITALHNAICAGHFDIVKFLVEFGCDVNAQDSDGWTPLHCAASCNNLAMVKFLVENGACLFAATLSDHETPAEKCEEDEEGFDGCSEYLYSIQEKLGILNNGKVYAVFAYEAQNSDELTFSVNDRLTILRKGDDAENEWWWAKDAKDEEGYVPRNLLGLYPRVPPQLTNFNE